MNQDSPAWESICNRCGLCCFEKTCRPDGRFETTAVACRYLDIVSRECRIYGQRLSADKTCVKLTPELVRRAEWLPPSCAYRSELQKVT